MRASTCWNRNETGDERSGSGSGAGQGQNIPPRLKTGQGHNIYIYIYIYIYITILNFLKLHLHLQFTKAKASHLPHLCSSVFHYCSPPFTSVCRIWTFHPLFLHSSSRFGFVRSWILSRFAPLSFLVWLMYACELRC